MQNKEIITNTIEEADNLSIALSDMKVGNEEYNSKKIVDLINELLEALIKVYNFGKINYTDEQISEQLYSISLSSKYGLYAILESIKRIKLLIKPVSDSKIQNNILFFLKKYFGEIFADLNNVQINKKVVKFNRLKGTGNINAIEFYNASCSLLNGAINVDNPNINVLMQTSKSLLRQAIELRLSRSIGIGSITINKKPFIPKRTYILDFINSKISTNDIQWKFDLKISVLNKIINWTNEFIHNGWIDSLWLIEWAQYITKGMFENKGNEVFEQFQRVISGDKSVLKPGETLQWSLYDSISMKQSYYESQLENELKKFIIQKVDYDSMTEDSLEINLMKSPECLLIK